MACEGVLRWETDAAEQILEAGIFAQVVEARFGLQPNEPGVALLNRTVEASKGYVDRPESRVDERKQIGGDVSPAPPLLQVVQNSRTERSPPGTAPVIKTSLCAW